MLVVGEKEAAAGTVAVRDRIDGDLGAIPLPELLAKLHAEVREKRIRQVSTASVRFSDEGQKFGN
jgi:threonyl-tRNA synthetase